MNEIKRKFGATKANQFMRDISSIHRKFMGRRPLETPADVERHNCG